MQLVPKVADNPGPEARLSQHCVNEVRDREVEHQRPGAQCLDTGICSRGPETPGTVFVVTWGGSRSRIEQFGQTHGVHWWIQ